MWIGLPHVETVLALGRRTSSAYKILCRWLKPTTFHFLKKQIFSPSILASKHTNSKEWIGVINQFMELEFNSSKYSFLWCQLYNHPLYTRLFFTQNSQLYLCTSLWISKNQNDLFMPQYFKYYKITLELRHIFPSALLLVFFPLSQLESSLINFLIVAPEVFPMHLFYIDFFLEEEWGYPF